MLADFDERRFMEPRGRGDKVLFRFHESEPDGHGLRFVIMRLTSRSGDYTTEYLWTHHTPLTSVDYRRELQRLGASEARLLGGWDESAFDEDASDALIVVARK
jgi:hypothetical protein